MASKSRILARQLAVILGILLLWALGDSLSWFNRDVLPPMAEVAAAMVEVLTRPEFFPAVFGTLRDALLGVVIAAVFGVPIGLIIGISPRIENWTRILLDFGRSFPVVALVPIFVLMIGTNAAMKVTMVAMACFFPILLQTIYGARRLDPTINDTIQSFRIPARMRFTHVVLPAASPFIATGLRLAVSISILVAVGTEVLTQVQGIGAQISLSRTYNEVAIAFSYMLYAGFLGVLLTQIWDQIEARLLSWHHRTVD